MISTAFAAAEKAGAGLPQFETSNFPSQIFWAIISFGILLLLFRKYILPPIHHILDERVSRIRGDMEEAEKMKQQAEQVLVDYQQQLASIHERATEILDEAQSRAEKAHSKAMQQLEEDVERKKAAFAEDLEYAREQAMKEVKGIAVEISMLATKKLLNRNLSREEAGKMVESSIEEIRSLSN